MYDLVSLPPSREPCIPEWTSSVQRVKHYHLRLQYERVPNTINGLRDLCADLVSHPGRSWNYESNVKTIVWQELG